MPTLTPHATNYLGHVLESLIAQKNLTDKEKLDQGLTFLMQSHSAVNREIRDIQRFIEKIQQGSENNQRKNMSGTPIDYNPNASVSKKEYDVDEELKKLFSRKDLTSEEKLSEGIVLIAQNKIVFNSELMNLLFPNPDIQKKQNRLDDIILGDTLDKDNLDPETLHVSTYLGRYLETLLMKNITDREKLDQGLAFITNSDVGIRRKILATSSFIERLKANVINKEKRDMSGLGATL